MLFLRYYLWFVPHVVLGVVLIAALQRRLQKQLPFFFVFLIFELIQFLVLFSVSRIVTTSTFGVYLWFLTCGAAINAFLQLGVLYELADNLILSRTTLKKVFRPALTWTLGLLVLIAAVASGTLHDVSRKHLTNGFEIVDFFSSLIIAGMLIFLFVFSRALHISWRNRVTGVALGFGIMACINLAAAALRSGLGKSGFVAVDIAQMAALHVSVVVWLVYLFLPKRTPVFAGRGLSESDIQIWDQELQRITGR